MSPDAGHQRRILDTRRFTPSFTFSPIDGGQVADFELFF
jgi:hypothetical protein